MTETSLTPCIGCGTPVDPPNDTDLCGQCRKPDGGAS